MRPPTWKEARRRAAARLGELAALVSGKLGLFDLTLRVNEDGGLEVEVWPTAGGKLLLEGGRGGEEGFSASLNLFFQEERSFFWLGKEGLNLVGQAYPTSLLLLPEEKARRIAPLLRELHGLLRAFGGAWRERPEGALAARTGEALAAAVRLLERVARGRPLAADHPFRAFSGGGSVALWNTAAHPFPGPLELLPRGGPYRGPVPGRPGVLLEGEVVPGSGPEEARLLLGRLLVGSLSLRPRGESVPLFAWGPLYPESVLGLFPLTPKVDGLLRRGQVEEAAAEVVLSGLA